MTNIEFGTAIPYEKPRRHLLTCFADDAIHPEDCECWCHGEER